MKAIIIEVLVLLTLSNLHGQSEQTNQLTKNGLKTGKWVEVGLDGDTISIQHYKIIGKKVTEELFLYDVAPELYNESDSTVDQSILIGKWITFDSDRKIRKIDHYDNNGFFKMSDYYSHDERGIQRIVRKTYSKTSYIIGNRDSVEFNLINFYRIEPTNSFVELKTTARNLTEEKVLIKILPHTRLSIQTVSYLINAKDSLDIIVRLQMLAGPVSEVLQLNTEEWTLDLELSGYGYDLTTLDFQESGSKVLGKTCYYLRTGNEYLMEIIDKNSDTQPIIIPLSKQQVKFELNRGNYVATIVSPSGRTSKDIKVQ